MLDKDAVRAASRLENVIPELTGYPVDGTEREHVTLCPFHDDHRPSLRVNVETQLYYCPVCAEGGDVFDFVARYRECSFPDALAWLAERGGVTSAEPPPGVIETYPYMDLDRRVLFEVVRYVPKDFRQRRPDGNGGHHWNLKGVRRLVYRWPDLKGPAVCIPEGEKDVDRLWAEGIPATTCAGGAGKWRREDAAQLKETGIERVVIIPDNDEPGRDHAKQVATHCHTVGLEVRIVTLDVPEKGDVSDYLDRHSVDELRQVLKDAPVYEQPVPTDGPRLVTMADVEPEEVHWLWPGRLALGKFTLLIGDPGLGKSFVTLDTLARISRGTPFPDGAATNVGHVVLLSAEDGLADTIRPRLDAMGADVSRVHALEAARDKAAGERWFSLSRDLEQLRQAVEAKRARCVVIDPLSAYMGNGTDTYKDSAVRSIIAPLAKMAEEMGVAVVGIAHLTKSSDTRAIHRALGSVAFAAAARIVLAVCKDPQDEDRRFVASVKSNLGPEPDALAYRLVDGRVAWEDQPICGLTADQLLSAGVDEGDGRDAVAFLEETLGEGPLAADQVLKDGKSIGFSESTLRRAKRGLGVTTKKIGFGEGACWKWSLPSKLVDEPPKAVSSPDVTAFEADPMKQGDLTGVDAKAVTKPEVTIFEPGVTTFGTGGDSQAARQRDSTDETENGWGKVS